MPLKYIKNNVTYDIYYYPTLPALNRGEGATSAGTHIRLTFRNGAQRFIGTTGEATITSSHIKLTDGTTPRTFAHYSCYTTQSASRSTVGTSELIAPSSNILPATVSWSFRGGRGSRRGGGGGGGSACVMARQCRGFGGDQVYVCTNAHRGGAAGQGRVTSWGDAGTLNSNSVTLVIGCRYALTIGGGGAGGTGGGGGAGITGNLMGSGSGTTCVHRTGCNGTGAGNGGAGSASTLVRTTAACGSSIALATAAGGSANNPNASALTVQASVTILRCYAYFGDHCAISQATNGRGGAGSATGSCYGTNGSNGSVTSSSSSSAPSLPTPGGAGGTAAAGGGDGGTRSAGVSGSAGGTAPAGSGSFTLAYYIKGD